MDGGRDAKILIVEDLPFTRRVVKDSLIQGGYTKIMEAGSGAEALLLFAQEKPALVILDINLPDRKDLSLLRELLEMEPAAQVIMYTAVSQHLTIQEAKQLGAWDYFTKPFEMEDFLRAVENALAAAQE